MSKFNVGDTVKVVKIAQEGSESIKREFEKTIGETHKITKIYSDNCLHFPIELDTGKDYGEEELELVEEPVPDGKQYYKQYPVEVKKTNPKDALGIKYDPTALVEKTENCVNPAAFIPNSISDKITEGIKIESGERRQFSTGATRQAAAGKGRPSLFPADAYIEICKHFEVGGISHGDRNWEKGLPISCYIDSLERHIAALKMNKTDERHDRAIAWNAVCLLATIVRIQNGLLPKELDDLPKYGEQK